MGSEQGFYSQGSGSLSSRILGVVDNRTGRIDSAFGLVGGGFNKAPRVGTPPSPQFRPAPWGAAQPASMLPSWVLPVAGVAAVGLLVKLVMR